MDFLLASVSQMFEATSVVWRGGVGGESTTSKCKQGTETRGGGQKEMVPNNNQCVHLAAVTKSC